MALLLLGGDVGSGGYDQMGWLKEWIGGALGLECLGGVMVGFLSLLRDGGTYIEE